MNKVVITADVHIHPYRICSHNNGADRLRDGLDVLRRTLDIASEKHAMWIMAGDFKMPKTNWPQEALTGALDILRHYTHVEKVMLAGNHDAMGLGGSGLQPFRDKATDIVDGEAEEIGGILYVPFGADLSIVKKNKHLPIVSHGFLRGAFLGPEDMRLPEKGIDPAEFGQFPVAFFGDIHNAQYRAPLDAEGLRHQWRSVQGSGPLRMPGRWRGEVYYPGSPYQQSWGERDHVKGVLFADLRTGSIEFIEIDSPRFVHVELVDCEALPEKLLNARSKDFVRIITPSARWTQGALDARGLDFQDVQIIERKPLMQKQAVRAMVHAAMDSDEMLRGYMHSKPVPEDLDPELIMTAHRRLWASQ